MSNQILDDKLTSLDENKIQFRRLAIVLESFVWLSILIALFTNQVTIRIICLSNSAIVLLFSSWYIFKADRFRFFDVLLALFSGFTFSIVTISWLFELNEWPNGSEMSIVGLFLLSIVFVVSGIIAWARFARNKNNKWEYSMSYKLFSRAILFFVFSALLGTLKPFFDTIF